MNMIAKKEDVNQSFQKLFQDIQEVQIFLNPFPEVSEDLKTISEKASLLSQEASEGFLPPHLMGELLLLKKTVTGLYTKLDEEVFDLYDVCYKTDYEARRLISKVSSNLILGQVFRGGGGSNVFEDFNIRWIC